MTLRGLTPQVEERLLRLAEANAPTSEHGLDEVMAVFMAGARDTETRALTRRVLSEHRDFFDMVGDR